MSLNVKDLLKKAEAKGIKPNKNVTPSQQPLFRPWQQESVLFNKNEKLISSETIIKQKPDVNWQQTGNKLATNRKQIDNKLATNWQQTGNKLYIF